MQKSLPPTVAKVKGWRSALLKRTSSVWHDAPKSSHFAIPSIDAVAVELPGLRFAPTSVYSQPLIPPISEVSWWDFLLSLSGVSGDYCDWETITHELTLTDFSVRVFGKTYRTQKSAEETEEKPEPTGIVAGTKGKQVAEYHPYAHLYDLLYPPPLDVIAEQIPSAAKLHDYQKVGVDFLVRQPNALLADDMGLGKTAQCAVALAILRRTERVGRTLIICPKALIRQWEKEAEKWGGIFVHIVRGDPRTRRFIWQETYPRVLLTTPNIVQRDAEIIKDCRFDLVICDDLSVLKNPESKTTRAIRSIRRERAWCLNGTPLENKPEDFMNVMEFVKPNLFSAAERQYAPNQGTVPKRVAPHFLRRRKKDVLKELPPKVSVGPIELDLEGEQARAYAAVEMQEWNAIAEQNIKIDKIHIFAILNKLLQLCNYYGNHSAKADIVEDQIDEIFASDPTVKAILFSRWVDTLHFLERRLHRHKPLIYHGQLSDSARQSVLQRFQGESRLLLISTKAGARGLNLQQANYVFHFDRTWNPVDEMQAEDRCWRQGQTKDKVLVYRFMATNTIEERVHEILTRKQALFNKYIDSMTDDTDSLVSADWSVEELIGLLKPQTARNPLNEL